MILDPSDSVGRIGVQQIWILRDGERISILYTTIECLICAFNSEYSCQQHHTYFHNDAC